MKFDSKKIITNIYVRNILLMALIFVIIVFVVLFWLSSYTRHDQKILVPNVRGLQIEEAAMILRLSDIKYEVVDSIYEKRGFPGSVLEQTPSDSSFVKEGRTVYLTVQAKSEQLVSVPDLTDYSQRQAISLLNALGFNSIAVDLVPSTYKGLVISVDYKGAHVVGGQKIPKGSFLRMKVGNGFGGEDIPDFDENIESIENIDPLFNE